MFSGTEAFYFEEPPERMDNIINTGGGAALSLN